jgi:tetratricopeptide (TPR) repeat protein
MSGARLIAVLIGGGVACAAQSGRLLMESGAPPERATVEKVCGGAVVEKVETDREGGFELSEGGAAGDCVVRARAGGLRAREVRLSRIPDGKIGTMILHPSVNAGRVTVSVRSLAVPDNAREAYLRGMEEGRRNRLDKARSHLEKAVRIYPAYAEAWLRLGFVFERMGLKQDAVAAFRRAAEADPESVAANMRTALAAAERQDWEVVLRHTDRVIAARPRRSLMPYYYNALASLALNRVDQAEESMNIARELDPERTLTKLDLIAATLREHRGDREGAITLYRRYLAHEPDGPESEQLRKRIVELERAAAK